MTATPQNGAAVRESSALAAATNSDLVPAKSKFAYALGGTTDMFGHWLYNGLANPVFVSFLGLSATKVSWVLGITRLIDAFTDPLFGWMSDNTRSKWGRRRPFILFGSILAGLCLPVLFLASPNWDKPHVFWFMMLSASLYAPVISAYNMPYQSLGAELTPDYNERTSVMGWKAVVQKTAEMLLNGGLWFATLPLFNMTNGKPNLALGAACAAAIAGSIMIVSGFANFFWVKERYYVRAEKQERVSFLHMFDTFTCRPYLVLLGTALIYAIPTGLVGSFGYFATTYVVCRGDMAMAGTLTFWGGAVYAACGIACVPVATRFSRLLGKKKALTYTLVVGLIAFGSSWWLYTPEMPWLTLLCSGLNGFSATGLWVILPSMCVDIVDYEEVRSGKRREGAYNATFSWVLKVGMSASMFIVGPLLDNVTGFRPELSGNQAPDTVLWIRILFAAIPVGALLVAFLLVQQFPLTPKKMADIRAQLEATRGKV